MAETPLRKEAPHCRKRTVRRHLRPNDSSLMYEETPQQVTWTLVPMLVVAIGGLIVVFGVLGLVVVVTMASNDSQGQFELGCVLLPIAACAGGGWAIGRGIKWARQVK